MRGLRASISASISRFSAIARLRAPTIASVTQTTCERLGMPSTARIAPTKANGSANTVCSSLTSETKRRALTAVALRMLRRSLGEQLHPVRQRSGDTSKHSPQALGCPGS